MTPAGLWAQASQVATSAPRTISLWAALAAPAAPGGDLQVYTALASAADPAQYAPRARADVAAEQLVEGGQTFTVLRSASGTYLRLTSAQADLWRQMDGSRTVAALGMYGLMKHRQLLPVGELVSQLRIGGFLVDPPVGVYRQLAGGIEARSAEGVSRRVLATLVNRTFGIPRIDAIFGAIYRFGGRLLFTRPALLLAGLIGLAGALAFGLLLARGRVRLIQEDPSATLVALALFYGALLISFVLHESGHALALKHAGHRIRDGGVMLYYGLPVAYVDTSDIWLASRGARMAVSAAGPASDLVVGGLAALAALAGGDATWVPVAYSLALACYTATLFNLNPLLEYDGYHLLVDWLRIPDLRRRAFAFVSGPLLARLRTRTALSADERLLAIYGLLAALMTAVAVVAGLLFWERQVSGLLGGLWVAGPLGKLLAVVLAGVVVVPVLAALLLAALGSARVLLGWLLRRGYGRRPALVAAGALVLNAALALLAARLPAAAAAWLPPALWALALTAQATLRPDYRRAAISPALHALMVAVACSLLAATGRALLVETGWAAESGLVWLGLDALACVALLVAGVTALFDVDLRLMARAELLVTALVLVLAFVVGGVTFYAAEQRWPGIGLLGALAIGLPAYLAIAAAALLLPHLLGLRESRLSWAWGLHWLGLPALALLYAERSADALAPEAAGVLATVVAGLWAAAWGAHLATLRQLSPAELSWAPAPALAEAQRLCTAFTRTYAGLFRLLHAVYGARRAQALDNRMDVLSATIGWDVTLDRETVRVGPAVLDMSIAAQGARYGEVLRYAVEAVAEIAGEQFARRALQAAYDALPWQEREALDRHGMRSMPWGRYLSHTFGDERERRLRLLRQVTLLAACDDDTLAAIAAVALAEVVPAGRKILSPGETAPGVWIIDAGEIDVWREGQVVRELWQGDQFGAEELLRDAPAEVSYRAGVESALLFVPAADYRRLVHASEEQAIGSQEVAGALQLLERVPLFVDVPRHTLRGLAMIAARRAVQPREVVVRQGVPSGQLYIVRAGTFAVLVREHNGDGTGAYRVVAQLEPGEFFGELEMLRNEPPTAHVVARTAGSLLVLPHGAIAALLAGEASLARELEQIGSARLKALASRPGVA